MIGLLKRQQLLQSPLLLFHIMMTIGPQLIRKLHKETTGNHHQLLKLIVSLEIIIHFETQLNEIFLQNQMNFQLQLMKMTAKKSLK
jgi:hypothetical protein